MLVLSVVVVLSNAIMGTYLYQFYYRTIYENFKENQAQYLQGKMLYHESDLKSLNDVTKQVSLSTENTRFLLKDRPQMAVSLMEQLGKYKSVNQFYDMVIYQYHEDEYLCSNVSTYRTDRFTETIFYYEQLKGEGLRERLYAQTRELQVIPEQRIRGKYGLNYTKSEKAVSFLQTVPYHYDATLMFIVPSRYYDTLFTEIRENPKDVQTSYILYDGQIIVGRGSVAVAEGELSALLSESLETKEVTLSGKRYLLTAAKGESGLVYCTLQSMDIFHEKMQNEQWGVVLLLLMCMIPVTFLLMKISTRLVRKINKVNWMLHKKERIYSIGDIESGIQSLIQTQDTYEQEKLQNRKAYFIRNFVRGDYHSEEEVLQAASESALTVADRMYAVVLMGERSDYSLDVSHQKMLSVIKEAEGADGYGVSLVGSSRSLFVVFADSGEQIEEILADIYQIGKESCENFVMAVSNFHQVISERTIAYSEAETAYDTRFLQKQDKILRYKKEIEGEITALFPDSYLKNLHQAIKQKDSDRVRFIVEEICQKISHESPSLLAFRLNYNKLVHLLVTEWCKAQKGSENIYHLFDLSQCLNQQDVSSLLYDTCQMIMDSTQSAWADSSPVVEQAIQRMKERYAEPELTMSALAEELNITAVTLAVVFKNSMGIRPSDYLANIRMEEAKRLLRETNLKVRDVSLAVGYEDYRVFIRRFEKYTGKSPSKYRSEL